MAGVSTQRTFGFLSCFGEDEHGSSSIAALCITLPEWPVLQMVMHGRQDMTASAEAKPARDIRSKA